MIFRAAWSCFLVRKEPLVEERRDETSHNTRASPALCPLGTLAGEGGGQNDGGYPWAVGMASRGGKLGPYLLRAGRGPVGRWGGPGLRR